MTLVVESVGGVDVLYDSSGFGFRHTQSEVTEQAVRNCMRAVSGYVSAGSRLPVPESNSDYSDLIWTPWRIASNQATPGAVSERLRLRSAPLWDMDQVSLYCGKGPYTETCLDHHIPQSLKIETLRRVHKNIAGLRLLDIGAASGTFMAYSSIFGIDAYGIEIDPVFILSASPLLRDRLIWGDCLCNLYAFNAAFFDVVFVSCVGFIMRADLSKLLLDVWRILDFGKILVLELPQSGQDVSIEDKVSFGPYIRPLNSYKNTLSSSGFSVAGAGDRLLVASKTHTPLTY